MKRKIFSSIFITAVASLLFTVLMTVGIIYTDKNGEVTNEVKTQAAYLSAALSELDAGKQAEFLAGISDKSDNRLTLIASDGTVLYDNRANAADMENHLDRPEVASALADGSGEATRDSDTIGKQTYYYALKLSDGSVIRIPKEKKHAGLSARRRGASATPFSSSPRPRSACQSCCADARAPDKLAKSQR